MSRYADMAKGIRARRRTVLPLLNGQEPEVDLIILKGSEQAAILAEATKAAQKDGVADPKDGNPIFALAIDCETVARSVCCVLPPDAVPDAEPIPFFANANEVRDGLDRERIVYMAKQQRVFQEHVSPAIGPRSLEEYWAHVVVAAEAEPDAELPFEHWPTPKQRDFVRFTCSQLSISLQRRSSPTTESRDLEKNS